MRPCCSVCSCGLQLPLRSLSTMHTAAGRKRSQSVCSEPPPVLIAASEQSLNAVHVPKPQPRLAPSLAALGHCLLTKYRAKSLSPLSAAPASLQGSARPGPSCLMLVLSCCKLERVAASWESQQAALSRGAVGSALRPSPSAGTLWARLLSLVRRT